MPGSGDLIQQQNADFQSSLAIDHQKVNTYIARQLSTRGMTVRPATGTCIYGSY